jgi:hypothetical protein
VLLGRKSLDQHCGWRYTFPDRGFAIETAVLPLGKLVSPPANRLLFSTITHLGIFHRPSDHEIWRGLAYIPHSTNLSFKDERLVGGVWLNLLRTCKSLRVLVVLYQRLDAIIAGHHDEQELVKDSRFVAMGCQSQTKDWRMGAHTVVDYWSRTEALVAKRRSGQIDGAASPPLRSC